jgi:DNA-binding transcriptional LysR family regulator
VLPLVESELGLAFLPEEMVEKALKNNDIVKLELDEDIPRRYVCMIYDSKRPISVAAQKFKKILLEESNM